ncbi:hypothetical protein PHMEG_00010004 [Phytophthora megakarya]|uniref:Uncharacterized protein n=1 Tax=Phytophthora megakarya TaxID=4795 RepID=A0A225WES5_9STRA|nr:hypothetical protein PHMEG_00010004 [Phytophthora megakarya]
MYFCIATHGGRFGGYETHFDVIQVLDTLVRDGVWFSKAHSGFFWGINVRRECQVQIPSYYVAVNKPQLLQLDTVHLLCVTVLDNRDFKAMFYAIVAT